MEEMEERMEDISLTPALVMAWRFQQRRRLLLEHTVRALLAEAV